MGRLMIPVCCVCGRSPGVWHDRGWESAGGRQDYCPDHAAQVTYNEGHLVEYQRDLT